MEPELKAAIDGLQGENKKALEGLASKYAELQTKNANLQRQVDAIDQAGRERHGGAAETKSIAQEIFEHPEFKAMAEMGGRGRVAIKINDFHRKSLTETIVGYPTSGVMPIDRLPGIVPIQFRLLRIRDLLRSVPTEAGMVDFVKVNTFTNNASPTVEASLKNESDMTLTPASEKVQVIAHWIHCSKQVLSDLPGLSDLVNNHLLYGLRLKEETQLLSGDGTGVNLHGLVTQATAFNTALLNATAGYNRLDIIARAIQQAERADYSVDTIVLHTDDFWSMALTKSSWGTYLFGDPSASTVPRLWGRSIAVTNSLTSGSFLVGSSQTAVIRDRLEAIVDISENVNDDFIHNLVTLRCEERLALQVTRPASWITGSFTTSPVS
jgi:HK97 family phage major capsid protein